MNRLTVCKYIHSQSMEPGPACQYFYVTDQTVFAVLECSAVSQTAFIETMWSYNDEIVQHQASFYTPSPNHTNKKIVSYIHIPVAAHRKWYGKWKVEVNVDHKHSECKLFYLQPPVHALAEYRTVLDIKV